MERLDGHFSKCPICGASITVREFLNSKDSQKLLLKEKLAELVENEAQLKERNIKIGIPCCYCHFLVFPEHKPIYLMDLLRDIVFIIRDYFPKFEGWNYGLTLPSDNNEAMKLEIIIYDYEFSEDNFLVYFRKRMQERIKLESDTATKSNVEKALSDMVFTFTIDKVKFIEKDLESFEELIKRIIKKYIKEQKRVINWTISMDYSPTRVNMHKKTINVKIDILSLYSEELRVFFWSLVRYIYIEIEKDQWLDNEKKKKLLRDLNFHSTFL